MSDALFFFLSRKKDVQTVGPGKLDLPLLGNDLLFFCVLVIRIY